MTIYDYESLSTAPLIQNCGYRYGPRGGSANDPLSKLLKVGNTGGIRSRVECPKGNYAFLVLLSNDQGDSWEDGFIEGTDTYRYHGDNEDPTKNPRETTGNKAMVRVFDNKNTPTPLLIFHSERDDEGGFVKFIGLGIPMNYSTEEYGNPVFKNIIYNIKVLNIEEDIRTWILGRLAHACYFDYFAPRLWKDETGMTFDDSTPNSSFGENDEITDVDFQAYLSNNGFDYDSILIEDFLLGLKVKRFMIFSGATGTGKTRLAQMYSRYRRINGAKLSIIPVGPNWNERRFILGYHNALTNKYIGTDSLSFLRSSSEPSSANDPYILVLDEMNLSHIERYLSDILSMMESGEDLCMDGDPDGPLTLKDNVFIIGTINMDETTYSVSPKVLDRANVITFDSADVGRYLNGSTGTLGLSGNLEYLENCMSGLEVRSMKAPEILNRICTVDPISGEGIDSTLRDVQGHMSSMELPLGYRNLDEIMRFMYVSWVYEGESEFTNWRRYMDSQILMKVLPKVHGDTTLRKGLESLSMMCESNGFQRSGRMVDTMLDVLSKRRYTSFIG